MCSSGDAVLQYGVATVPYGWPPQVKAVECCKNLHLPVWRTMTACAVIVCHCYIDIVYMHSIAAFILGVLRPLCVYDLGCHIDLRSVSFILL